MRISIEHPIQFLGPSNLVCCQIEPPATNGSDSLGLTQISSTLAHLIFQPLSVSFKFVFDLLTFGNVDERHEINCIQPFR